MSEHLKAFEAEIRADERAKFGAQLNEISDMCIKLSHRLSDLGQDVWNPGLRQKTAAKAPKSPATARKHRAPVSATEDETETVLEALRELQRQHVGRYFAVKELCGK